MAVCKWEVGPTEKAGRLEGSTLLAQGADDICSDSLAGEGTHRAGDRQRPGATRRDGRKQFKTKAAEWDRQCWCWGLRANAWRDTALCGILHWCYPKCALGTLLSYVCMWHTLCVLSTLVVCTHKNSSMLSLPPSATLVGREPFFSLGTWLWCTVQPTSVEGKASNVSLNQREKMQLHASCESPCTSSWETLPFSTQLS